MKDTVRDEGFGIVEALVAILLFGVLAVAMVPPIILAIGASAEATTVASAGQVAQGRIEESRNSASSCADMLSFLATTPPSALADSRGVRYSLTETATAVKNSDGSTVDAKADPSWCVDGEVQAVTFTVQVVALDVESTDAAHVSTTVAVPGISVAP